MYTLECTGLKSTPEFFADSMLNKLKVNCSIKTEKVIDIMCPSDYWSNFFGLSKEQFEAPGLKIVEHSELR